MDKVLPIFRSHYSIGRSILTLNPLGSSDGSGPDSIIDICHEAKLKTFYLVDDSMSGFLEAYTNSQDAGLELRFGLRVNFCNDISEKDKDTYRFESKCIVFCNNKSGYENLIKIYSTAARDGFYHTPRLDKNILNKFWGDGLTLAIPFYDSFIHKNKYSMGNIVPDFGDIAPSFFIEDNDLPFDDDLAESVKSYAGDEFEVVKTKTIYYKDKSNFLDYVTFRCISSGPGGQSKNTLNKPGLDHMCSDEFCFESWKEVVNG